jgi:hypothetical protein
LQELKLGAGAVSPDKSLNRNLKALAGFLHRRRDEARQLPSRHASAEAANPLRALGEEIKQDRRGAALQSLLRKKIVEKDQNGYRLSVEMYRFWILKNQIRADDLRREAPITLYGHN